MGAVVTVMTLVGFVASLAGGIMLLIAAFKKSIGTGFLTLCVPFYVLYFAFKQYQSPKKKIVLIIWLGGTILYILGGVLQAVMLQ